jgi:CheY-like chemotaxis protein
LEVIREIKTRWPDTHVIAMTGYVDVELRQQSEKLGVDRFIENRTV